jgi:alpha-D-xyloside xylohydrolase
VTAFTLAPAGLALPVHSGEHFFGLGERFDGLDLSGTVVEGWIEDREVRPSKRTSYVVTPFLISSRGYGVLLDTSARSTFDIAALDPGCMTIEVVAPELRAVVIEGPDLQLVLERHARLVGLPPLPPRWAFGVWKNLIGGEPQVLADLHRLAAARIPIDAVWIYDAVDAHSGFGWPWKIYGPAPQGTYPGLADFVRRLHAAGLRVLGYLNPFLYEGTAAFEEARRRGFLVGDPHGGPAIQPWKRHADLDFTNPAAVSWWEARIRSALIDAGFDGAMQDFGEDAPVDGIYASGKSGATLHNRYPVLYARAVREAAQAAKPDDTVFFARSAFTGSEQYLTGGFTGDQERSWDAQKGLPSVVSALLSASISGLPYWGPDIAGFIDGPPLADEKELWIRWLELGALTPTMRDMLGAEHAPVDLWTDQDSLRLFGFYARLHTALIPYLYRHAEIAHERGLPIMRPLFLDFPHEAVTYRLESEYLLGDDVLVAPVTRPAVRGRLMYLPSGSWRDAWTGRVQAGPSWVVVNAPVEQVPLFERMGTGLDLPGIVASARSAVSG